MVVVKELKTALLNSVIHVIWVPFPALVVYKYLISILKNESIFDFLWLNITFVSSVHL